MLERAEVLTPLDGVLEVTRIPGEFTILESGRRFGNTDPRFCDPLIALERRAALAGAAGCLQLVSLVPEHHAEVHVIGDKHIKIPRESKAGLPINILPDLSFSYDPATNRFDMVLPCDGLVTNRPKTGLFAGGADCTIFGLMDLATGSIGLGHGGRRGAIEGIVDSVLDSMSYHFGTKPHNVVAYFGTSIGKRSYRLEFSGPDIEPEKWGTHLEAAKDGGYYMDITGYLIARLINRGVSKDRIFKSLVDVAQGVGFYSYRGFRNDQLSENKKGLADGRNGFLIARK